MMTHMLLATLTIMNTTQAVNVELVNKTGRNLEILFADFSHAPGEGLLQINEKIIRHAAFSLTVGETRTADLADEYHIFANAHSQEGKIHGEQGCINFYAPKRIIFSLATSQYTQKLEITVAPAA